MEKRTTPKQEEAAFLKRRMMSSRIMGILACMLTIVCIMLMYFGIVSEWLCIISLCYAMATIFSSNSFLQSMKMGNAWQRVNTFCSVLFYLAVLVLIVYGFIAGYLVIQF